MAYDIADTELYQYSGTTATDFSTFGATTQARFIQGPPRKVGFVRDLMVDVLTALVGTTSVPELDVGIASADFTFGRYRLGTAIGTGYPVGFWRASQEADIIGNPPRTGTLFASHVVLDGGPYGTGTLPQSGQAGGTFLTQSPLGRIPASPVPIINIVSGTGSVWRVFVNPAYPLTNWLVGQTVAARGVPSSVTGNVATATTTISAINLTQNYLELTGTTFGGTYPGGGYVYLYVAITGVAGVGGTPAGGGAPKVKIQWLGAEND
jgi:hypothetical protein